MIQFDEHIFQMGWFNHQPDQLYDWSDFWLPWTMCFNGGWLESQGCRFQLRNIFQLCISLYSKAKLCGWTRATPRGSLQRGSFLGTRNGKVPKNGGWSVDLWRSKVPNIYEFPCFLVCKCWISQVDKWCLKNKILHLQIFFLRDEAYVLRDDTFGSNIMGQQLILCTFIRGTKYEQMWAMKKRVLVV